MHFFANSATTGSFTISPVPVRPVTPDCVLLLISQDLRSLPCPTTNLPLFQSDCQVVVLEVKCSAATVLPQLLRDSIYCFANKNSGRDNDPFPAAPMVSRIQIFSLPNFS